MVRGLIVFVSFLIIIILLFSSVFRRTLSGRDLRNYWMDLYEILSDVTLEYVDQVFGIFLPIIIIVSKWRPFKEKFKLSVSQKLLNRIF